MDPEVKENSESDDLGDFDKNMQDLIDSGAPMGSAQSFLDYFGFSQATIHSSFFKRGKWWASVLYNGSEIWATGETEEQAKNEAISMADIVIAEDRIKSRDVV